MLTAAFSVIRRNSRRGKSPYNASLITKGGTFLMKKNSEISRMFQYAGNRHWLTVLGMILAGLSTVLSMIPFVCIWFVVRDMIHALMAGDISLASHSSTYAWAAAGFSILSILLYFIALCCSHLAANGKYASMWKDYQTSIHWKVEIKKEG